MAQASSGIPPALSSEATAASLADHRTNIDSTEVIVNRNDSEHSEHVDVAHVSLLTCLRQGEECITTRERLERLRDDGYRPLGMSEYLYIWQNKHLIPESWKTKTYMMEPEDYYTHDFMSAVAFGRSGPPPLKMSHFPTYICFEEAIVNLGDDRLHRYLPDGTVVKEPLLVTLSLVWTGREWSEAHVSYDRRSADQPAAAVRIAT